MAMRSSHDKSHSNPREEILRQSSLHGIRKMLPACSMQFLPERRPVSYNLTDYDAVTVPPADVAVPVDAVFVPEAASFAAAAAAAAAA